MRVILTKMSIILTLRSMKIRVKIIPIINGPSVLAVKKITEKANALGLGSTSSNNGSNSDNNNFMI